MITSIRNTKLLMSLSAGLLLCIATGFAPHNADQTNKEYYWVQQDDMLTGIAVFFGNVWFWEALYIANADVIENPHVIYPGQRLFVPARIAKYRQNGGDATAVIADPFTPTDRLPLEQIKPEFLSLYDLVALKENAAMAAAESATVPQEPIDVTDTLPEVTDQNLIEAFREAFEQTVDHQQEQERQILLELDGMIHDDTRSKIGRDFFDVFYSEWQPPDNARNYAVRINELPAPNMGTTIIIKVNHTEIFNMRLQPRYDFIEEVARVAARRTYQYVQQNTDQFQIY